MTPLSIKRHDVWILCNAYARRCALCATCSPPIRLAAMIPRIRQLLGKSTRPAVPPGERVYAIGDVHGRLDLFEALRDAIERDDAESAPATTTIVLLGDLIDRGADSAGVVAAARAWQQRRAVRIIAGNHEEMFLASFDDAELMFHFLRFGGRETVLSYPVADREAFAEAEAEEAQQMMREAVPASELAFIRSFEDEVIIGDYLFVHAGVRPGVALPEQDLRDLRWIRGSFTDSRADHGLLVVHGHTIFERADVRPNRIGIDTGAFYSGRLTALRLEGEARSVLETSETDGRIDVQTRSIT
jgi:serine/threonine protein phosphatase 1